MPKYLNVRPVNRYTTETEIKPKITLAKLNTESLK